MLIYFLTREPDACQLIADKLLEHKADIKIFVTISTLFENIFDKDIQPNILFFDYLYYQPDSLDPYSILKQYKKMFPIVYYNHPFPVANKRYFFWITTLQKTKYFSDLTQIKPILKTLEEALSSPSIAPYVSAIQEPKPYRSKNLRYIIPLKDNEVEYYTKTFNNVITDFTLKNKTDSPIQSNNEIPKLANSTLFDFINEFRIRNHLSHKVFSLFSHLYSKINMHVSLIELSNILNEGSQCLSNNGIRLTVHRLRKIISADKKVNLDLISFDHGYMLVEKK